ncbi:propionyl-CoA carboxylase beta chain [Arthrobacter sp. Hiyo4]|nr:propionyl-CoA carboxylase beta chain [Arthrobacter sp. Hiyo4]
MSHDLTTTAGKIADFRDRQARAEQPSGPEAIEKQHARGKNTARERVDLLLDEGSFVELDALAVHRSTAFGMEKKKPLGDGLVSGYGTVDGRPVAVYSQDFSVYGGSLSQVNGEKIVKVQEFALRNGCPVVGILDGGGARIQEGVASLAMFADIFRNNVHASGVVPQISLIMGPSAGGAAYSPALTDYVVMVDKTSHMFITGPDVIKTVTGEDVDMETLGGARQHNANTGTSTYLASDEADAIEFVRELLDFLPSNNLSEAPVLEHQQELEINDDDLALDTLVPDSANQPYDMRTVIEQIVDDAHFLEMQSLYAPTSSSATAGLRDTPWGSWPTSRSSSPARWTLQPLKRPPASSGTAMPSTSPSSPWWMCPASCPARTRNSRASSAGAPSCCTPTPKPPSPS